VTRPIRRLSALGAVVAASALVLAGCSTPPWLAAGDAPSAAPSPSASATEAPQPTPNDLSSGATQRSLTAGPLGVAIDYWSTLPMADWSPGVLKPVNLSLITSITPNDGQKVFLQRATMTATPGSATETFDPLSAQVDAATTTPGYLVLDPYSYSQVFTVGPTPDAATYVTLEFSYEFLVQSTPTSSDYAKQTATDTLTVAITP